MSFIREGREFQIAMLELQIEHAHITFGYTILLAVGFSLLFTILATLIPMATITSDNTYTLIVATYALILTPILTLLWMKYIKETANLQKQIKNLKKQYLW